MTVVAVFEAPTLTREGYDESIRRLTDGRGLETLADWPVEGIRVHIAGESERGFRVVDVWDSEEALGRFAEILMPILQDVGIDVRPEMYPTHKFVSA